MEKYLKIIERIKDVNKQEESLSQEDGVLLIKPRKDIAIHAWEFVLYPGLNEEQLEMLQGQVGFKFHPELIGLYRALNGLRFFSGKINIYGYLGPMGLVNRSIDPQGAPTRKPIGLNIMQDDLPKSFQKEHFILIGGSSDGSRLLFNNETGIVLRIDAESGEIAEKWDSLENSLNDLVNRNLN